MNIFVSTWALLVGGLVTTLPMIYLRVKEHTEEHEEISNILYVHVTYSVRPSLTMSPQCRHGLHQRRSSHPGGEATRADCGLILMIIFTPLLFVIS